MRPTGIYRITSKQSGKFYIGSAVYIKSRWARHRLDLRNNNHGNKHLQSAWNLYGEHNFIFEIIELCDKEKLIEREQFYIDTLNPPYNKARTAGSTIGVLHSEATKEKLRIFFKGRSPSNKGIPRTPETIQRLKDAWVKRKLMPRKQKIKEKKPKEVNKNKRKLFSDDAKERMSKSQKAITRIRDKHGRMMPTSGHIKPFEHPMKGKKHSDETKDKLKRAWIRRKNNSGIIHGEVE